VAHDRASHPEPKPLRLFVAVDVPDDVRSSVAAAVEPLHERFPHARWSPPNNWHLTLKFLGRTPPRLEDWVAGSVERVAERSAPFEISVLGLGAFPSARRSRVLWAGLADPRARLAEVAALLDAGLASEFEPEKRAFTPHLTVARFDPPLSVGEELPEVATRTFVVRQLVLYRSRLGRPAPVYEAMRSFPLAGG
jgi:2'-5' RNA ligase